MGTLQRKGRGCMIEEAGNPVSPHPIPTLRHMTTVTPSGHSATVGIVMAGTAIGSIQRAKDHYLPFHVIGFPRMTAATLYIPVEPIEWIPSLGMVEGGWRTPTLFIVAGTALAARKLFSVRVL